MGRKINQEPAGRKQEHWDKLKAGRIAVFDRDFRGRNTASDGAWDWTVWFGQLKSIEALAEKEWRPWQVHYSESWLAVLCSWVLQIGVRLKIFQWRIKNGRRQCESGEDGRWFAAKDLQLEEGEARGQGDRMGCHDHVCDGPGRQGSGPISQFISDSLELESRLDIAAWDRDWVTVLFCFFV